MLYNNAQYKNESMDQGSVVEYYKKLKDIISTNDGTRSFIIRTEDCHDQNAPFNQSQETRLRITHNDHMISQITEGFINFNIKLTLQLSEVITDIHSGDEKQLGKIFVGFKSSNQLLDQLQIYSNNISSGYQQNECCREGFCYSTIKPYSEKKTRKYTHSLYENVSDYSQSVCGTYVDLNTLMDGQKHDVEFEMNLPFEDMLAFQAFDLYPNRIVGDIEIRFYVKPVGLVYCQVDPRKIKEVKEFMEDESIAATFTETPVFLHQFTQIGNESKIAALKIDSGNVTSTTKAVTLSCHGLTVTSCKSNMFGFGVKESTLQAIASMFSEPVSIPSQQLDYNAFPLAPTRAGVQSTINAPLNNTTSISVMFPKHSNDYTCFDNPIYHNVQLTINGQNYPDEPISTLGARFLQYQLVASELDGGIQCTKEYEDSLTMIKNNETTGKRFKNTLSDASSFMINIQTERSRGGYLYDGLDSNGQNIPIQIRGQPIYSDAQDTYFNYDESGQNHPPPPQLFICRDTYFTVDTSNGLVYHPTGSPPGSQA
mgnify:FL=1